MARGMGAEWMYREAVDQRRFWTPTQDPPIWYDAGEPSTLSGDMQTLQDRGGSGLAATQATAGTRPGLAVDALSGLPVLTFNGSQDMTAGTVSDFNFLHNSNGSTISIMVQAGTSANPNAALGIVGNNGASGTNIGYTIWYDDRSAQSRSDGCVGFIARGVTSQATADSYQANRVTPNQISGWTALGDPNNATASSRIRFSINGDALSGANTSTFALSSANATFAFSLGSTGNGAARLVGRIAEMIIYRRLFTSAEAEGLQGYQHHRWNRASLLPAGHRFRNRPRLIGEA